MGKSIETVEVSITDPVAEEIEKQKLISCFQDWFHKTPRIVDGPGMTDLLALILEPKKENGELKTFLFHAHVAGREAQIPCQVHDVFNICGVKSTFTNLRLKCHLDNFHTYLIDATYSFRERKGNLRILEPK